MVNQHLKYVKVTPETLSELFTKGVQFTVVEGLNHGYKCIGMNYDTPKNVWMIAFSNGLHKEGSEPEEVFVTIEKKYLLRGEKNAPT